jgi:hypothetical protein
MRRYGQREDRGTRGDHSVKFVRRTVGKLSKQISCKQSDNSQKYLDWWNAYARKAYDVGDGACDPDRPVVVASALALTNATAGDMRVSVAAENDVQG